MCQSEAERTAASCLHYRSCQSVAVRNATSSLLYRSCHSEAERNAASSLLYRSCHSEAERNAISSLLYRSCHSDAERRRNLRHHGAREAPSHLNHGKHQQVHDRRREATLGGCRYGARVRMGTLATSF